MKHLIRSVGLLATIAAAACGSPKPAADTTTAMPAVDTLKAAGAQADSLAADTSSKPGATTGGSTTPTAKSTTAKTGTKVRADSTKILGRDSVIMPKGRGGLPPVRSDTNPR